MEFDSKRLLKLAGIPDDEPTAQVRSAPRPLTESARRAPRMSADEQKLRALIRREAGKMLQERAFGTDVTRVQQRKSLTEAITMGFAGIGFGSNRGVLGGPMTSASRFASLYESEVEEIDEGEEVEEGELGESDYDNRKNEGRFSRYNNFLFEELAPEASDEIEKIVAEHIKEPDLREKVWLNIIKFIKELGGLDGGEKMKPDDMENKLWNALGDGKIVPKELMSKGAPYESLTKWGGKTSVFIKDLTRVALNYGMGVRPRTKEEIQADDEEYQRAFA